MSNRELSPEKIEFEMGDSEFTAEQFSKIVKPYFQDLIQVGRTNYLFATKPVDGSKPQVTGYRTNTTINATINSRAIEAEKAGGTWAVYRWKG